MKEIPEYARNVLRDSVAICGGTILHSTSERMHFQIPPSNPGYTTFRYVVIGIGLECGLFSRIGGSAFIVSTSKISER